MINQSDMEKWTKNALDMARFSIETGVKNLDLVQEQTNKAVDFALTAASSLQKETESAYQEWKKATERARRIYTESIENGLEMISKMFDGSGGLIQPKSASFFFLRNQ